MLNEIEEFRAYTDKPIYSKGDKKTDLSFLGRFSFNMFKDFNGFGRVFTILAQGYLHGNGGDPYDNIDYARRALCAWCSIPDKKSSAKKRTMTTAFGEYHDEFPELVDKKGNGWLIRHVHGIISYVNEHQKDISEPTKKSVKLLEDGFDDAWRDRVIQFQMPIYTPQTKGTWITRFDDAIAEALEIGELRDKSFSFSAEQQERIKAELPKGLPYDVAETVLKYCIANKPEDSEWTVLPIVNFDAYFGGVSFSSKQLKLMPKSLLMRNKPCLGVTRAKTVI